MSIVRELVRCLLLAAVLDRSDGFVSSSTPFRPSRNAETTARASSAEIYDDIISSRYACTRFQPSVSSTSTSTTDTTANTDTPTNSTVISLTTQSLDKARRSPTGFNVQPYKSIIVSSPAQKSALAKYCLGRNADRVRDSDCTVVFCADKEIGRDWKRYQALVLEQAQTTGKELSTVALWKIRILVLLFSSGYPLPRILASPISFCVRLGTAILSAITRRRILIPSLSNAETWATKNTMLMASTFLNGVAARGLESSPMEGFNAGGVRKVLGIPRRFSIPMIISVGTKFERSEEEVGDEVGMGHGKGKLGTLRYGIEETIYTDSFGNN